MLTWGILSTTHTHTKRINRLTSLIVLILIQGCWDGDHEQEGGTWSVHWTFFLSAGSILTGRRQPKIVSSIIRYPSSHSSNREIINPTIWRGRNHHTVVWLVFNSKMWPLLYYFSTVAPLRFMNVGLTYTHLDSRSRSQPIQNMYTVKKKKNRHLDETNSTQNQQRNAELTEIINECWKFWMQTKYFSEIIVKFLRKFHNSTSLQPRVQIS